MADELDDANGKISALRSRVAVLEGALKFRPFVAIETPQNPFEEFLVYRPDAGVFAACWVYPEHPDGGLDVDGGGFLCSLSGEDLTNDPPTLWLPYPHPEARAALTKEPTP